MRVMCSCIEDFLENLGKVVGPVHVQRTERVLTEDAEVSSVMVGLQASAVVEAHPKGTEERILVQCGEECGVDYYTSDGSTEGTDEYKRKSDLLEEFCGRYGFTIMPGILDF